VPTLPPSKLAGKEAGLVPGPAAVARSDTSFSPFRPLIIIALCLSFAAFAIAATPAHVVPWRRVSYFVHERHVELTMFGLALLATAGFAILLTKA
jgi:hypothetical protein